jgi:hypothetical protein
MRAGRGPNKDRAPISIRANGGDSSDGARFPREGVKTWQEALR